MFYIHIMKLKKEFAHTVYKLFLNSLLTICIAQCYSMLQQVLELTSFKSHILD